MVSYGSGVTALHRTSYGAPPVVRKKDPFFIRFVVQGCPAYRS